MWRVSDSYTRICSESYLGFYESAAVRFYVLIEVVESKWWRFDTSSMRVLLFDKIFASFWRYWFRFFIFRGTGSSAEVESTTIRTRLHIQPESGWISYGPLPRWHHLSDDLSLFPKFSTMIILLEMSTSSAKSLIRFLIAPLNQITHKCDIVEFSEGKKGSIREGTVHIFMVCSAV